MNKIDELPLHPKNKILLYSRYLLSKISWNFTVSDISKTWICETLDGIASKYFRKWLELPVSATLSNVLLPQNRFGLNIILPSTKFIQCQNVSRVALRSSPNVDINNLWAVTSTNKNIQYDIYNDTKDVLKAVRKENEERLQNQLIRKVLSFQLSLIIPHPHSTPYGHPFKANFRKTSLTSLSGISITHFRQEKTYQNGDNHRHLIALFAPHPKRCFISLLDVRHT